MKGDNTFPSLKTKVCAPNFFPCGAIVTRSGNRLSNLEKVDFGLFCRSLTEHKHVKEPDPLRTLNIEISTI
jgi:hypothetical protein